MHKDVWFEYARTWCDYPYQMPYHLRFGNVANPEDSEEILYGAFEDLAFADNQTTVRCYNGDSDNGMTTRYLTVCDCAGRMDDLYSWYDYCSTSIYEEDEINTCILGDDGMTTLLCVPFEEAKIVPIGCSPPRNVAAIPLNPMPGTDVCVVDHS